MKTRIFAKVTRENLQQIKDRFPFLYLEHGRLEIDAGCVKWTNENLDSVSLPCATINCLMIGPGVSITHNAIKLISSTNCTICWVGEDGLIFYAVSQTPNANTRNMLHQMSLAFDSTKANQVAKNMYSLRFPEFDVSNRNITEMRGLEGQRVKSVYSSLAKKYKVNWTGRNFTPGNFEASDVINKYITSFNSFLYGLLSSVIHGLGYSPHVGFIHSGSPLPFVYDIADLYKESLTLEPSFYLTANKGEYNRSLASEEFRKRVIEIDLLNQSVADIQTVLKL